MPENTTDSVENEPVEIEFIQFHQPPLKDGDYIIKVEQSVHTINDSKISQTFDSESSFSVAGERFALDPSLIHSVFPPEGSLGEHSNVLPHIILNRSTLPWERLADTDEEDRRDIPWLALLLFDSDEAVTSGIVKLSELLEKSDTRVKWPGISLKAGQHADDKVTVIEVERGIVDKMLPPAGDLSWLAHVRQGKDDKGVQSGDRLAVVIGNRLPRNGGISTAYLVSVEGRYKNGAFDYQGAEANDLIRLVSLKSWSFACVDKKQDFKGLLENLNPYSKVGFDRQQSILRLPPPGENSSPEAEKYLARGFVPLPHFLRQGGKTVSWYHGPMVPGELTSSFTLPVRAADELLRYNPVNGMFDVSYAAAWELGQRLVLQSKKISIGLYQWKRSHAQQQKQAEQQFLHAHLPGYLPTTAASDIEIPKDVASWFGDLSLLRGVPFNYLVPDEQMLPKESIRFFRLDRLWVDCLLDGAFSIGRVKTSDHKLDQSFNESPAINQNDQVSGCLLRSEVVSGWPGLQVDAYDDVYHLAPTQSERSLKLLRMERLSANILLCLFAGGEMKRVEIHQKPETLHFGFDVHEDPLFSLYKTFRDDKGEQINDARGNPLEFELGQDSSLWQQESRRIVNISRLAETIQSMLKPSSSSADKFTSAQFALQMIEGVEKVIFQVQK